MDSFICILLIPFRWLEHIKQGSDIKRETNFKTTKHQSKFFNFKITFIQDICHFQIKFPGELFLSDKHLNMKLVHL